MSSIDLFGVLPPTLIQDILSRKDFFNLDTLYQLNYEVRLSLLDLIYTGKIVFSEGIVYASGDGQYGVLGDGRTYYHEEGTPIPIDTTNMKGKRVIQVVAGHRHSLFLCDDGSVYASGGGSSGRLGDGRTDFHQEGTPIPIDTANMQGKRVTQVAAGYNHSLFLCDDGSVYASGQGQYGVLGDGRTDYHQEGTPIPIDTSNMEGKRVIQVAAAGNYSLFLCKDGSVYASGRGQYGRLGDGRTDFHQEGTPIPIDTSNMEGKRVIQVAAGGNYSLFLCEDGSVYSSGFGEGGVLGDGRTGRHNEGTPIPIDTSNMKGKRIVQVSAGSSHSLFLCEDDSVYAAGNGVYGILGDGRTDRHQEGTPIPIDTSNMEGKRVTQVAAASNHSLFLCKDGSVYASGRGQYGRLGDGRTDRHEEGTPIPIDTSNMEGKRVIQVAAGNLHSLFLT